MEMLNLATDLLITSMNRKPENNPCHLCLIDQAKAPVFCLQCLKIVSCKWCFLLYLTEEPTNAVKCLNCQRISPKECSLFARVYRREAGKVHEPYYPYRKGFR
ncbi:unnamed protein product [Bursaphelenchus okinawaensis]|uniref:Uncharacterized protein n=1 Tax=Bursaphelenchus okinawaensis TaxID=465554 RepID=A0A811JQH2_9BILA|nr:unnamed protein product [Bursaphelenchus okinawaensis]CAG9077892.1 unnamed protein product [Bursaphelenchus okinawaensis]